MQYRKIIKMVACAAVLLLLISLLTGCSAAFAGFPVGGREELRFACDEPEADSEPGYTAETLAVAAESKTQEDKAGEADSSPEEPSGESPGKRTEDPPEEAATAVSDGKVDLNTAGLEELMTLNGIGQTRAQAIIDYRTRQGAFTKIEDIMQIPGIKEGIFSKIKDEIVVR